MGVVHRAMDVAVQAVANAAAKLRFPSHWGAVKRILHFMNSRNLDYHVAIFCHANYAGIAAICLTGEQMDWLLPAGAICCATVLVVPEPQLMADVPKSCLRRNQAMRPCDCGGIYSTLLNKGKLPNDETKHHELDADLLVLRHGMRQERLTGTCHFDADIGVEQQIDREYRGLIKNAFTELCQTL